MAIDSMTFTTEGHEPVTITPDELDQMLKLVSPGSDDSWKTASYEELVSDLIEHKRSERVARTKKKLAEFRLMARFKQDDVTGCRVPGHAVYVDEPEKVLFDLDDLKELSQRKSPGQLFAAILPRLKEPDFRALIKKYPELEGIIEDAKREGHGSAKIVIEDAPISIVDGGKP